MEILFGSSREAEDIMDSSGISVKKLSLQDDLTGKNKNDAK